jgi:hypothetical protein
MLCGFPNPWQLARDAQCVITLEPNLMSVLTPAIPVGVI